LTLSTICLLGKSVKPNKRNVAQWIGLGGSFWCFKWKFIIFTEILIFLSNLLWFPKN
jgi:hypothetical protein